jgi:hypothetical protein
MGYPWDAMDKPDLSVRGLRWIAQHEPIRSFRQRASVGVQMESVNLQEAQEAL